MECRPDGVWPGHGAAAVQGQTHCSVLFTGQRSVRRVCVLLWWYVIRAAAGLHVLSPYRRTTCAVICPLPAASAHEWDRSWRKYGLCCLHSESTPECWSIRAVCDQWIRGLSGEWSLCDCTSCVGHIHYISSACIVAQLGQTLKRQSDLGVHVSSHAVLRQTYSYKKVEISCLLMWSKLWISHLQSDHEVLISDFHTCSKHQESFAAETLTYVGDSLSVGGTTLMRTHTQMNPSLSSGMVICILPVINTSTSCSAAYRSGSTAVFTHEAYLELGLGCLQD